MGTIIATKKKSNGESLRQSTSTVCHVGMDVTLESVSSATVSLNHRLNLFSSLGLIFPLFQVCTSNGESLAQQVLTEACVEMDVSLELPNGPMNDTASSSSLQPVSQETVRFLAFTSASLHLSHSCLCLKVSSTNITKNKQQQGFLKRNKRKQVASKETCRNCKSFLLSTSRRTSNIQGWCFNCFRLIKEIQRSNSLLAAAHGKIGNLKLKLKNAKRKMSRTILTLEVHCFIK